MRKNNDYGRHSGGSSSGGGNGIKIYVNVVYYNRIKILS